MLMICVCLERHEALDRLLPVVQIRIEAMACTAVTRGLSLHEQSQATVHPDMHSRQYIVGRPQERHSRCAGSSRQAGSTPSTRKGTRCHDFVLQQIYASCESALCAVHYFMHMFRPTHNCTSRPLMPWCFSTKARQWWCFWWEKSGMADMPMGFPFQLGRLYETIWVPNFRVRCRQILTWLKTQ